MKKEVKLVIEKKVAEIKGENVEYYNIYIPVMFMGTEVPVQLVRKTNSKADKIAIDLAYANGVEIVENEN